MTEDRLIEIAPGVHAERLEDGSIAISGTGADVRKFLDSTPPNMPAAEIITGAYLAAQAKAKGGAL
jgi:hypothetical protein